jgi:hypothetical protein
MQLFRSSEAFLECTVTGMASVSTRVTVKGEHFDQSYHRRSAR